MKLNERKTPNGKTVFDIRRQFNRIGFEMCKAEVNARKAMQKRGELTEEKFWELRNFWKAREDKLYDIADAMVKTLTLQYFPLCGYY